jgi:hypothetical protein
MIWSFCSLTLLELALCLPWRLNDMHSVIKMTEWSFLFNFYLLFLSFCLFKRMVKMSKAITLIPFIAYQILLKSYYNCISYLNALSCLHSAL